MSQNIIFFGTPPFAVQCLKKMVAEKFNIVAVVTAPDRPAGRGRQIKKSAVKEFSEEHNLRIIQPTNLKDPGFAKQLKGLSPDLMVVVAFRMLPKVIWAIPPKGTFNLHASLLPRYRGAAPINWVLINQEQQSGVTTFFINEEIDTGAILLQETVTLNKDETAGSLHDKLALKGSELICTTIKGVFDGSISPKKQDWKGTEKKAPKLNKENIFIDWNQSLESIHAKIKGLSPYPGAKSQWIEDQKVSIIKIFEAKIIKEQHHFSPRQVIVRNQEILISHPAGFLNCTLLQFSNKKKMNAKDILNGTVFSTELVVG
jgi:methionyl-tRNA formyltransferase